MQLLLPVTYNSTQTFSSFVESEGLAGLVVKELRNAIESEEFTAHYLAGQHGVGCTHLLNAACHFADEIGKTSILLPLEQVLAAEPGLIDGLDSVDVVCIDNIHLVSENDAWQTALFNLFNALLQNKATVIFAGHDIPINLNLTLPDLGSRLQWCTLYQLPELTEALKIEALIQHAHLMEFEVTEEVAKFIINRLPRNMIFLMQALDTMARQSVAMKRVVTVPFVKEVLGI
ncbi:DnaA regulatory inactivator Hda [Psychrosphaera haliotis]|nr:DnaA regulatory inactivator Hda [Psychrosphaera haliotis]